ncbi:MAG: GNAT family N-acetyltransferase [Pseudomonadota bacterium]
MAGQGEVEWAQLQRCETPRLLLRPPQVEDALAIFDYARDPQVCRFLAWRCHRSLADAQAFVAVARAGWERGDWLCWVVEDAGGVVGTLAAELGRDGAGIGYAFSRRRWGRGYATEALAALSDRLFAYTPLRSQWAFCLPENAASTRVLEKCGFRSEGVLRRYFACPNLDGERRDVWLFGRHRGETRRGENRVQRVKGEVK